MKVALGLGSNLGDGRAIFRGVLTQLNQQEIWVIAQSDLYQSVAWGPPQPDYLNMVVVVETELPPIPLLHELIALEQRWGRVRTVRWGPRTLDLDILLYRDLILETEQLTIPHPGLLVRNFALLPLATVAADWVHPQAQAPVFTLAQYLDQTNLNCLGPL